ncbi:MAG: AzlD domain-containing protein [Caldilineaceae bacterium]|nr:AzlD domain-containing protein [Caldilineaceae bacterium]
MTTNDLLLVLGMALVTFAMRYPVLALVSRLTLPPSLLAALKFIPPAVLTAIIVPALLAPDGGKLDFTFRNDYLIAGLVTALVAWRTKNILLTLATGMIALWGWRLLLAWLPPF